MIFPPESIYELRRELAAKMASGELTEAEVFRQALAVDSNDPAALRYHAFHAEEAGDREAAAQFGRRFILADPTSHEGYLLVGRVLADPALAAAYRALGEEKLHFDPEAEESYESSEAPPSSDGEPEALAREPEALAREPEAVTSEPEAVTHEPEAVAHELEPHRLVHELFVAGIDAVEPDLIDRVLARGADCAPLLLGVLNACGEDILHETDDGLVVRSLALLGEIGDPAALPALAKFIPLEDDTVGGAARWAFLRIARRHPAETLEVVRNLTAGAEAVDLAALAQQLCLMPDTPGRKEALLGLAINIPELDDRERALVIVSMITSAHVMEGANGELAASLEGQYGAMLNREARKELKSIREVLDEARAVLDDEEEPSIYDVACDAFEAHDEEEKTVVRQTPKLGRNEPCWCGSGKKYKRCHLDADASR